MGASHRTVSEGVLATAAVVFSAITVALFGYAALTPSPSSTLPDATFERHADRESNGEARGAAKAPRAEPPPIDPATPLDVVIAAAEPSDEPQLPIHLPEPLRGVLTLLGSTPLQFDGAPSVGGVVIAPPPGSPAPPLPPVATLPSPVRPPATPPPTTAPPTTPPTTSQPPPPTTEPPPPPTTEPPPPTTEPPPPPTTEPPPPEPDPLLPPLPPIELPALPDLPFL